MNFQLSLTWNTVTMAHNKESKFFLSGTVSPVSVRRLNLQPKICIPRMLWKGRKRLRSLSTLSSLQLPAPPGTRTEGDLKPVLTEGDAGVQRKDLPGVIGVEWWCRDSQPEILAALSLGTSISHHIPGSRPQTPIRPPLLGPGWSGLT